MLGFYAFLMWFAARADGSAPFPDDATNHWVYAGLAQAKRDGLLVGYSDGLVYHEPPKNRWSQTLPLLQALARFGQITKSMPDERRSIAESESRSEAETAYNADYLAVMGWRERLPFFRRAEWEFMPQIVELRKLLLEDVTSKGLFTAAEVERAVNRVQALGAVTSGESRLPFPDVHGTHWAASSLTELRRWGLIDGYPDKRFHP